MSIIEASAVVRILTSSTSSTSSTQSSDTCKTCTNIPDAFSLAGEVERRS